MKVMSPYTGNIALDQQADEDGNRLPDHKSCDENDEKTHGAASST